MRPDQIVDTVSSCYRDKFMLLLAPTTLRIFELLDVFFFFKHDNFKIIYWSFSLPFLYQVINVGSHATFGLRGFPVFWTFMQVPL